MKAEYVQRGETIDYINPMEEVIAAGDIVALGKRVGIAGCDIPPQAVGSIHVVGVFDVAKANATDAIATGDDVYYTAEGAAKTGEIKIGWAVAPSPAGTKEVRVKI